jgi:capsular polysaccharide biosynthesis protein
MKNFKKLHSLPESNFMADIKNNYKFKILDSDENGREIWAFKLHDVFFKDKSYYPDVKFISLIDNENYEPIDEEIMSLKKMKATVFEDSTTPNKIENIYRKPLFYFIYNTDNYYHFVYDTLPYIYTFLKLKKEFPDLKLLVSPSNFQKKDLFLFVYDFLAILNIKKSDLVFLDSSVLYSELYVSNSLTHSGKSEVAPREEIFDLFNEIKFTAMSLCKKVDVIKKIYVSRRTWLHNDVDNIGTNYTQRRVLQNEDELVSFLSAKGYVEIFSESLSTIERICLFAKAEKIIGTSGGGLVNTIFSGKQSSLLAINSPLFDNINRRFRFSYKNTNVSYFDFTKHLDEGHFKKYMRVVVPSMNIVGEIIDKINDQLLISYTTTKLAGWNSELKLSEILVNKSLCISLDGGLNSPWEMDMTKFRKTFCNFDHG